MSSPLDWKQTTNPNIRATIQFTNAFIVIKNFLNFVFGSSNIEDKDTLMSVAKSGKSIYYAMDIKPDNIERLTIRLEFQYLGGNSIEKLKIIASDSIDQKTKEVTPRSDSIQDNISALRNLFFPGPLNEQVKKAIDTLNKILKVFDS